jgi:hypothetical protein
MDDTACVTTSTGATKPVSSISCTLPTTCVCQTDGDCPSSHWACDTVTHTCVCSGAWGGAGCDVPLVPAGRVPGGGTCTDGVIDASGDCCRGYISTTTGICCPDGASVDGRGQCCTTGSVDACGVCGGEGKAVDVLGTCCSGPLLSSGLCCTEGTPDSCGVCGGLNHCPYVSRH